MQKKQSKRENFRPLLQILRGAMMAAGTSIGLMLVLACAVLLFKLDDGTVTALDQAVKALSILAGVSVVCRGGEKRALRGACVGLCYMLFGMVLYCALAGRLLPAGVMAGEMAFGTAAGLLSGLMWALKKA